MKRFLINIFAGLAVGLGGLSLAPLTAYAVPLQTSFKNIVNNSLYFNSNQYARIAYHAKHPQQNAYIWNDTHTQKLYNLKSYPDYSWLLVATGSYKGSSHWLQVANVPGTKRGWIYSSQLTKGLNPKGYQIVQRRFGTPAYFHVISAKQTAYLWDWTHTKQWVNLKNYTNQNLYRTNSVQVEHDGKLQWYDYVTVDKNGKYIGGYAPASDLTAGKTPNHHGQNILLPDDFITTKDYVQYLNDSQDQKLARAIIKLFPNTPVDLGLSRIAAYNYATDDTWDEDAPEPMPTKGYTKIMPFTSVATYLMAHKTKTNAQKLAAIKTLLAKQGYPQSKRNKLTNYKLGIYVLNNVMGGKTDESGHIYRGNWYGLVIGKKD